MANARSKICSDFSCSAAVVVISRIGRSQRCAQQLFHGRRRGAGLQPDRAFVGAGIAGGRSHRPALKSRSSRTGAHSRARRPATVNARMRPASGMSSGIADLVAVKILERFGNPGRPGSHCRRGVCALCTSGNSAAVCASSDAPRAIRVTGARCGSSSSCRVLPKLRPAQHRGSRRVGLIGLRPKRRVIAKRLAQSAGPPAGACRANGRMTRETNGS